MPLRQKLTAGLLFVLLALYIFLAIRNYRPGDAFDARNDPPPVGLGSPRP